MPAEIVAASFLELGEEARRPVRLSRRIVDFVGVVEERAEAAETRAPRTRDRTAAGTCLIASVEK